MTQNDNQPEQEPQPDSAAAAVPASPRQDSVDTKPPPRAFAQGTGVLFQVIGFIMFLTSCCVCSSIGSWEIPSRGATIENLVKNEEGVITLSKMFDHPGATGIMLTAMFATVGGLTLTVFGLGLQSDKPKAAWGALITTVGLSLVLGLAAVCLWIDEVGFSAKLMNHLLLLTTLFMAGFSIAALKDVRKTPPPPGMDILPADFEIPKSSHH